MKPVRFFTHQGTVWYNLADYIQLLLDMQIIRSLRPASLYKRKRLAQSIHQVLFDKLNRLNPVYQRHQEGAVYVDWVVFEHLYRFIRPFLIRPDDWVDSESLFRQLQLAIDHPGHLHQGFPSETMANYFTELKSVP